MVSKTFCHQKNCIKNIMSSRTIVSKISCHQEQLYQKQLEIFIWWCFRFTSTCRRWTRCRRSALRSWFRQTASNIPPCRTLNWYRKTIFEDLCRLFVDNSFLSINWVKTAKFYANFLAQMVTISYHWPHLPIRAHHFRFIHVVMTTQIHIRHIFWVNEQDLGHKTSTYVALWPGFDSMNQLRPEFRRI
jgi:hypothetical protein